MFNAVFTFGAMEEWNVHFLRRVIVHNGGKFIEGYYYPGLSIDATFPTEEARRAACEKVWAWMEPVQRDFFGDDYEKAMKEYPHEFGPEQYMTDKGPTVTWNHVKNCLREPAMIYPFIHPIKGLEDKTRGFEWHKDYVR